MALIVKIHLSSVFVLNTVVLQCQGSGLEFFSLTS